MRIPFVLFLCLCGCQLLSGQPIVRITLSERVATLEDVLLDVTRLTGYNYVTDSACVARAGRISFSVHDARLSAVLDSCVRGKPVFYFLSQHTIHVKASLLVRGWVVDSAGRAVPSATVTVTADRYSTAVASDGEGAFRLALPATAGRLLVTCVGYEPYSCPVTGDGELVIRLQSRPGQLADIVVSNGFGDVAADKATGSYDLLGPELTERRVSPNVLDRMDGVTSGLLVNTNVIAGTNQSAITIRGRSTIFSDPDPLIVVDNFPYSGDINNINPQDIESITVLKDAAAAALWGTRAANGVIVIKTKQGRYGHGPRFSFVTSLTAGQKPNLYYTPILSSPDYIGVEEYLFAQHFYDNDILSADHPALSPVVEILLQQREGLISAADTATQLAALRRQDTRHDLDRYWYRPSLNQQYWLGVQGGSATVRYALSAGLDQDLAALVRNAYTRITACDNNTYQLIPHHLELSTGVAFTASTTTDDNTGNINSFEPYLQLADAQGNALAVPYQLNLGYAETAGGGQLLNWLYRPLDELRNADNVTRLTDLRLDAGLHYTILPGLYIQALYRYGQGSTDNQDFQSIQTYFTRNLINEYTQINPATGQVTYPIPVGGIMTETTNSYQSHNGRLQIDYGHRFGDHDLQLLAGSELEAVPSRTISSQLYGYDPAAGTSQPVSSYTTYYTQYSQSGASAQVPYLDNTTTSADHYWSYYSHAIYQYRQRLTFTASGRIDQSNLFGVDIDHKTLPLWSAGAAWDLSREDFWRSERLSFFRLRLTDGYNGNVYKGVAGFTTLSTAPGIGPTYLNNYGASYANITNPPNPNLRWEQVHVMDGGADFGTRDSSLTGSADYYSKTGRYLIGQATLDPTSGNTGYLANIANMATHGIDLTLGTKARLGPVGWQTTLLFSYVRDKVTRYLVQPTTILTFFNPAVINPLVGKSLYSVYALKWAGLDPQNGNPMGWAGGHTSEAYSTLLNSTDFSTLIYKGPVNPPFFGSWRQNFSWRRWALSVLFVYKFGDYFTRPSIEYYHLFEGTSAGHPDFDRRWQQPGDEKRTNVPSMIYPANSTRDDFYAVSDILVDKGDLLRWQDLRVSYDLSGKTLPRLHLQALQVFAYANHIALLWTANRQHIDPDAQSSLPVPKSLSLGIKMQW